MNILDENYVLLVDLTTSVLELDDVSLVHTSRPSPDPPDDDDGEGGADDKADDAGDGSDGPKSDLVVVDRVFVQMTRFSFVANFWFR